QNGLITLGRKPPGKRSAGNPHAASDEAGAGNVARGGLCSHGAIERAQLGTLYLPCAGQFPTLPSGWFGGGSVTESGEATHRSGSEMRHPQSYDPVGDAALLTTTQYLPAHHNGRTAIRCCRADNGAGYPKSPD